MTVGYNFLLVVIPLLVGLFCGYKLGYNQGFFKAADIAIRHGMNALKQAVEDEEEKNSWGVEG